MPSATLYHYHLDAAEELPPLAAFARSPSPWIDISDDPQFSVPLTEANYADSRVSDKWGYFNLMYVGVDTPNGYVLGTPIPPAAGRTFSLSGDTGGLSIDSGTGQLTVSDATQIATAGTRAVTIAVSDLGDFAITVPVVDGTETSTATCTFYDSANGDDLNDGRQPHAPKQTLFTQFAGIPSGNILLKRGSTFTGRALILQNNRVYRGYGDPSEDRPVIAADEDGEFEAVYDDSTSGETALALGALSGSLSGRLAAGSLPGCLAGTRVRWEAAPGGAGSLGNTVASVAGGAVEKAV